MSKIVLEAGRVAAEKMLDYYQRMGIQVTPEMTLAPEKLKHAAAVGIETPAKSTRLGRKRRIDLSRSKPPRTRLKAPMIPNGGETGEFMRGLELMRSYLMRWRALLSATTTMSRTPMVRVRYHAWGLSASGRWIEHKATRDGLILAAPAHGSATQYDD